jgi:hypothetical protein
VIDDPDVFERQIVNAAAVVEEVPRLLMGEVRPGVRWQAQPETDRSIDAQTSLLGDSVVMLDRGSCPVEAMPCLCQRFLLAARLLRTDYPIVDA